MTRAATIAVVIPVKDRPEVVLRALESALRQTRPADEIIVVDDGSRTPLVLPQPSGPRPRIRLHRNATSVGGGPARNVGAALARSELIAFLDSDDEFLPDHLAEIEAGFRDHPDAAFVSTRFYYCDGALRPYKLSPRLDQPIRQIDLLEQGNLVGGCSTFAVRRDRFESIGGFTPLPAYQDYTLLLTLSEAGHGIQRPAATVRYRAPLSSDLDSITRSYRKVLDAHRITHSRFGFGQSRRARAFADMQLAYLLALSGGRGECLRRLLSATRQHGMRRAALRTWIALIVGARAYSAIGRLAARARVLAFAGGTPAISRGRADRTR